MRLLVPVAIFLYQDAQVQRGNRILCALQYYKIVTEFILSKNIIKLSEFYLEYYSVIWCKYIIVYLMKPDMQLFFAGE